MENPLPKGGGFSCHFIKYLIILKYFYYLLVEALVLSVEADLLEVDAASDLDSVDVLSVEASSVLSEEASLLLSTLLSTLDFDVVLELVLLVDDPQATIPIAIAATAQSTIPFLANFFIIKSLPSVIVFSFNETYYQTIFLSVSEVILKNS